MAPKKSTAAVQTYVHLVPLFHIRQCTRCSLSTFFATKIDQEKFCDDMKTDALLSCRSVPTEDQILVPETLLKKRKSQEKAREEKLAEIKKKKAVGPRSNPC